MKIKILFVGLVLLSFCRTAMAQSMDSLWLEMPDTLTSYLDKDTRKKMLDIAKMGFHSPTENQLNGQSVIDSISSAYMSVAMSKTKQLEIMKTTSASGDSCILVLSTLKCEELSDTEIYLYDLNWALLGKSDISTDDCMQKLFNEEENSDIILRCCSAHIVGPDDIEITLHTFPTKKENDSNIKNIKISSLRFK